MRLSGEKIEMFLSNRRKTIFRALELFVKLSVAQVITKIASMLAIVINIEIVKTAASFLVD